MKKSVQVVLSLFTLCALGTALMLSGVSLSALGQAQSDAQDEIGSVGQKPFPLIEIDKKSQMAKDNDESSVRALADEVVDTIGVDVLPTETASEVKDRLARAEIRYQSGDKEGIPERNVVRAVNGLVKKFGAPEYAITSAYEVRKLRMDAFYLMPQLIGRGRSKDRRTVDREHTSVGSSINPTMSPVEAFFITGMMLQQKRLNPEYQVTYAERLAKWNEKHSSQKPKDVATKERARRQAQAESQSAEVEQTARQKEVDDVIERTASTMSSND